jgi:glyoxylase I family protein
MPHAPIAQVVAPSHVAIEVSDLERSIAFYSAVLGFELFHDDRENAVQASVKGVVAGFGVELAQALTPTPPAPRRPFGTPLGSPFLSFAVSNIQTAFDELKALGHVEADAPTQFRGVSFFYLFDPDGQAIELIQFPEPLTVLADLRSLQAGA